MRKLLILRGPNPAFGVVNRHSGQAFIQGMDKIVDGERTTGRGVPRFDTLARAWMVWDVPAPAPRGAVLDQTQELDRFLAEIERRAFRMAQDQQLTHTPGTSLAIFATDISARHPEGHATD